MLYDRLDWNATKLGLFTDYVREDDQTQDKFETHSDPSWSVLRRVLSSTPLT